MKVTLIQWSPKGPTSIFSRPEHTPDPALANHVIITEQDLTWFYGDTDDIAAITESAILGAFEGRSVPLHALHFRTLRDAVYFADGETSLYELRARCGFPGYATYDGWTQRSAADDLRTRAPSPV